MPIDTITKHAYVDRCKNEEGEIIFTFHNLSFQDLLIQRNAYSIAVFEYAKQMKAFAGVPDENIKEFRFRIQRLETLIKAISTELEIRK